jgi:hypothetical protein
MLLAPQPHVTRCRVSSSRAPCPHGECGRLRVVTGCRSLQLILDAGRRGRGRGHVAAAAGPARAHRLQPAPRRLRLLQRRHGRHCVAVNVVSAVQCFRAGSDVRGLLHCDFPLLVVARPGSLIRCATFRRYSGAYSGATRSSSHSSSPSSRPSGGSSSGSRRYRLPGSVNLLQHTF